MLERFLSSIDQRNQFTSIMEQNSTPAPAVAYLALTTGNGFGFGQIQNTQGQNDLGAGILGTVTRKSKSDSGSDTRSSTDDSTDGNSSGCSGITQTTTESEIAICGSSSSSSSLDELLAPKDYGEIRKHGDGNGSRKNFTTQYYDNHFNRRRGRSRSDYEVNRTLWIGNIPIWASCNQVLKMFSKVGEIRQIYMPRKSAKKGENVTKFAFIGYKREESVPRALEQLQGSTLYGNILKLAARHGSVHEAHALSLENEKIREIENAKARKEELDKVRELARQRMEMVNNGKNGNLTNVNNNEMDAHAYGVKTGQNSTFQRHALEFQERVYRGDRGRCQSLTLIQEPPYRQEIGGMSLRSGSICRADGPIDYDLEQLPVPRNRVVEYHTPITRRSRRSPSPLKVIASTSSRKTYDTDRSNLGEREHAEHGPSYYKNDMVKYTDEEERRYKRKLEYGREYNQGRRNPKEMRFSPHSKYSSPRSLRPSYHEHRERRSRYAGRSERKRTSRTRSHERRQSHGRHRHSDNQSDHSHLSKSTSSTHEDDSNSARANIELDVDERSINSIGSHSSSTDSLVKHGSSCEAAPGSNSSPEANVNSAAAGALVTQIGPGELAQMTRMVFSNLEQLNTVAAAMGFQVTPTANCVAHAPEVNQIQKDSSSPPLTDLLNEEEKKKETKRNKMQSDSKKPDDKATTGKSNAHCRIM